MSRIKDLTGNKYGKLTVLSLSNERTIHNKTICICKCDCGNIDYDIIRNRLNAGWSVDVAVETPIRELTR